MYDITQLSGKLVRLLRVDALDYPMISEAVEHARPKIAAIEWTGGTIPARYSSDAVADEIEDYLRFHGGDLPLATATKLRDIVATALTNAAIECNRGRQ